VDGLIDQHHGETNASILPHVMRFNLSACPERFRDIARAMGEVTVGGDVLCGASRSIDAVQNLIADIGLAKGLSQLGLKKESIPLLSQNALKDACLVTNPCSASREEIEAIFHEAF
jgi:1,3-propanediol dehydrogenase